MRAYCFVDLDDTLFQTMRKCPDAASAEPAAVDRNGEALSFTSGKQRALFSWLSENTLLIPTTARNLDAFKRVKLSWRGPAIIDYGAVILDEQGVPDADWDARIRPQLLVLEAALKDSLRKVDALAREAGLKIRARIISDFSMSLYVVAKNEDPALDHLERLRQMLASEGPDDALRLLHNDNNLALVPKFISKEFAVEHLIQTRFSTEGGDFITLGMGDSLSDLGFMCGMDYCVIPQASQIMAQVLEPARV